MSSAFKKGTRITQIGRIVTEKKKPQKSAKPVSSAFKKKGTRITQIGRIVTEKKKTAKIRKTRVISVQKKEHG